jgi:hypothetical protein
LSSVQRIFRNGSEASPNTDWNECKKWKKLANYEFADARRLEARVKPSCRKVYCEKKLPAGRFSGFKKVNYRYALAERGHFPIQKTGENFHEL